MHSRQRVSLERTPHETRHGDLRREIIVDAKVIDLRLRLDKWVRRLCKETLLSSPSTASDPQRDNQTEGTYSDGHTATGERQELPNIRPNFFWIPRITEHLRNRR